MADRLVTEADDRWICDVLVVGAGPAGTAAALEATRGGCDVVVVDKSRFPRDKCCGDGLTAGALRHLEELGLDPGDVPSWKTVDEIHLRSPRGTERVYPLPKGAGFHAVVCRRQELDAALVNLVRAEGATVLEGHELTGITQRAAAIEARVEGITFQARYVIAADGMWSPTRRMLGVSPSGYRGEWHAFRQYFTDVTGPAAEQLFVWFEPDLLPGYAWSFPLAAGTANVGFGIQRGRNVAVGDMKGLWTSVLSRPHVLESLGPAAKAESPHRAWPIPARLGDLPLAVGRALFVGDAAAATDPMTGEGIGQAIETGRAAAQALIRAGSEAPERAADHYRTALERGMVRDHRLAQGLSALLRHPATAEWAMATAGATGWTRRNFGRWLFEDYPRAALVTPRRWHRRLFTKPGAYAAGSPKTPSPTGTASQPMSSRNVRIVPSGSGPSGDTLR